MPTSSTNTDTFMQINKYRKMWKYKCQEVRKFGKVKDMRVKFLVCIIQTDMERKLYLHLNEIYSLTFHTKHDNLMSQREQFNKSYMHHLDSAIINLDSPYFVYNLFF